ncbi:MAG TPA: bifunctional oligoribonuclease/PAP phosphatase NrnA, partial [Planctomycetota bacterium]|nr:bifunctional oligoribonuclease/PAP phosphatase NrnA [Planctomycetota bacterium]
TLQQLSAEQARALDLVRSGKRFVLVGHVRPDGDCLGAQAALSRTLTALGKEVWVINTDPLPPMLDYLAAAARYRVYTGGDLPAHDVSVFLDFCEIDRCGALAAPLRAASSKKLVIDHHIHHGERWWDEAFVDVRAAATGLLVWRMAQHLEVVLDARAAEGVFTSIVTDTGWFKYSNTDAETFRAVSELVAAGVNPSALYGAIYQRSSSDEPLGIARALERLEYFDDGKLAVVDLPLSNGPNADLSDSDAVLDLLRAVEKVEVVLFLRESRDGTCKLSARSKTARNVNELARRFGGGGHAKASGATMRMPLAQAKQALVGAALEMWGANGR